MRYAVLLAPDFRLQAVLRSLPEQRLLPSVLAGLHGAKSCVLEANGPARQASIRTGMTVTQATARCPGLSVLVPDEGQEKSAIGQLLQLAERFSPFIECSAPGVITLELARHVPVPEEMLREACLGMKAGGLDLRAGVAATPSLALLAARQADPVLLVPNPASFLKPLSLDSLNLSENLRALLDSWGVRTVGRLLELPMTDVCHKLGAEARILWEEARGGTVRPLRVVRPPETFVEETELEHGIETLEPLLFLLRRYLEVLCRRLEATHLAVERLSLELRFDDGSRHRRFFEIPRPTREVDLLFRTLHTHLEGFMADAPIIGLRLEAFAGRVPSEQSDLLDKGLRDPRQFSETLSRLQAMLGSGKVGYAEAEDRHRPDSFRMRPYLHEDPERNTSAPVEALAMTQGLPLLRFRPALPANVETEEGRPVYLESGSLAGMLRDVAGPWKSQGEWWDKRPWQREEWDAILASGALCRLAREENRWTVEGLYG